MTMTDPIADMFTRIRNGQRAGKDVITLPQTKYKGAILDVIQKNSYIAGWSTRDREKGFGQEIVVELKYQGNGQPVIKGIERISKPGKRQYFGASAIPRVRNGLGVIIMSTSQGVMSDSQARKRHVGGEALGRIW